MNKIQFGQKLQEGINKDRTFLVKSSYNPVLDKSSGKLFESKISNIYYNDNMYTMMEVF